MRRGGRHDQNVVLGPGGHVGGDAAEQKALAALKAELEKVLVAPLERDYAKQLELARERLERRSDASAQLTADS